MKLTHQFFHYVFLNIFGLLGTSCYILADTFLSPERPVRTASRCSTCACRCTT